MKNSLKTLSAVVLFAAAGSSVFAQAVSSSVTIDGTVNSAICTMFLSSSATGTTPLTTVTLNGTASIFDLNVSAIPTPIAARNTNAIYVTPKTSAGTLCAPTTSTGAPATTWNTKITATPDTNVAVKAKNLATVSPATNVTIDLFPATGTRTLSGLNLAGATAVLQHGISNATVVTTGTQGSFQFTPQLIKLATGTAGSGAVQVSYTFTSDFN